MSAFSCMVSVLRRHISPYTDSHARAMPSTISNGEVLRGHPAEEAGGAPDVPVVLHVDVDPQARLLRCKVVGQGGCDAQGGLPPGLEGCCKRNVCCACSGLHQQVLVGLQATAAVSLLKLPCFFRCAMWRQAWAREQVFALDCWLSCRGGSEATFQEGGGPVAAGCGSGR